MATYMFQLIGVTDHNLAAVKAALANVPNCVCTLVPTAMGGYLVHVETDLTEDEALQAVNDALSPLMVSAIKTIPTPAIVVGPKF